MTATDVSTAKTEPKWQHWAMIDIGNSLYLVDVKKIPYFGAFMRFKSRAGQLQKGVAPTHSGVPDFLTINLMMNEGLRHFPFIVRDDVTDPV